VKAATRIDRKSGAEAPQSKKVRAANSVAELWSGAFRQLDAVAEGVEDVRAAEAIDGRVFARGKSGALAGQDDFVEIVDGEGGMSTACGVKIGVSFNTDVKIHRACCEPDAVASGHRGRSFAVR
jgi:hypothetical protein